jgi:tetratricopeptide (TPR) repeat protein
MHDLVHVYSAEQARVELHKVDRDAAVRRLVSFYLHTAHAGESLIDTPRAPIDLAPSQDDCRPEVLPDRATAWAWYDREHPCLVSVQQLAMDLGWYRQAWQLACVTFRYHVGRGRLRDIVTTWQRGLVAAQQMDDPAAQSRAHRALAEAWTKLGDHDSAINHLREAMTLAESTGDEAAVTRTHHVLARVWGDGHGDYRRACDHISYVLRHCQTLDNHQSQIDARCDAAWFLAQLGEYEQARAHANVALALYREVGDLRSEACTLDTLGFIAHRTGQNVSAIEYYVRALQLRRGDKYFEPNSREHLGDFYASLGRVSDAREMWTGALDLYQIQQRATNVENVRQKLSALPHSSGRESA